MPGGFHPFHAGHAALYQSAVEAFPGAEVFVAATNDTSTRPFPFAIKEKLAKLAGVAPGHFVQVKSPFRAEEITAQFDPAKDRLIFVRSEKDANKPPQAGGNKKDGSPAYLQPLAGQTNIRPFAEHAYMAYLPTVEFGPGMTSATEIRTAWPTLSAKHKVALVMSMYPTTQRNRKLAATVVKLLDTAMGGEQGVAEGQLTEFSPGASGQGGDDTGDDPYKYPNPTPYSRSINFFGQFEADHFDKEDVNDATGEFKGYWNYDGKPRLIAYFKFNDPAKTDSDDPGMGWYYEPQNEGVAEGSDKKEATRRIQKMLNDKYKANLDVDGILGPLTLKSINKFIPDARTELADEPNKTTAVQGKKVKEQNVAEMDGQNFVGGMTASYQDQENQPIDEDYIDEKWSKKYKSSINCANPKGFSQKAHCAGRKK